MYIDHIAIWTNDLETMKDFYLKYFHCSVNKKYENQVKQYASYFLTFDTGTRIELMKRFDINVSGRMNTLGLTHFSIIVGSNEHVDRLTIKLEVDGYKIVSRPRVTGDGYYESVVLDPEDNSIEITATNDFKITAVTAEDLVELLYLQKCCYLSEAELYQDYAIPPLTQTIQDIQHDFINQNILKLEINHKIIGSVRGFMKENICVIGKLFVEREYQNMGFGKQLLLAIEQLFPKAIRFELFTGNKSLKNIHLYSKLGYIVFKEETVNGFTHKHLGKNIIRR